MISCQVLAKVEDLQLKDLIWSRYKEAFAPLHFITAQEQGCYQEDQFFSMLDDEEYIKFLVFDDVNFIGFGTLSSNLEKAARQAYANPHKIMRELSGLYPNGNIFYFPAIFIIPERRNQKENWLALIGPMVEHVDNHKGAAVFDFSLNANPDLAKNILFVVRLLQKTKETRTKSAEFTELDHQVYGVIKLS